jgi:hypothetical protein
MTGMMKKYNKSLRMGDDEAVLRKTGRKWQQWFTVLDSVGAAKMPHKQIAEYLYEKHGLSGWWSQVVTVVYEQERGLREKHQISDGFGILGRVFSCDFMTRCYSWSTGSQTMPHLLQ